MLTMRLAGEAECHRTYLAIAYVRLSAWEHDSLGWVNSRVRSDKHPAIAKLSALL